MGNIEEIICYLNFLNVGVWGPFHFEVVFDNGDSKDYTALTSDNIQIHIPEDEVSFKQDPETEEDTLGLSAL